MAEHSTPTWWEAMESDWKTQLRAVRASWVNLADEDAVFGVVADVGRRVVTAERVIRRVPVAEIMKLEAPDGITTPGTMREAILDSILDPMATVVSEWALKQWEAPHAD